MSWKGRVAIFGALFALACDNGQTYQARRFQSAAAALAQWHSHENDFRRLFAEWRDSSGRHFFPGSDSWWWNGTSARKTWWGLGPWRVTRLSPGLTLLQDDTWSLDEAARTAGLSGSALIALLQDAERAQVRAVEEVVTPGRRECARFDLKGGNLARPYGFLHCPDAANDLRLEQVNGGWLWPGYENGPASDYRVIDKDWAYFEAPGRDVPQRP